MPPIPSPTDICPFCLGQRVRVSQTYPYASTYQDDTYRITQITHEYRRGAYNVNIAIATDAEIASHVGSTDGFASTDLTPTTDEPRDVQPTPATDPDLRLVAVFRADLMMPPGKLAVQAGHAYLATYRNAPAALRAAYDPYAQPKIALIAADERALRAMNISAASLGVSHALITDAGRTVFPEPTVTALGLGPLTRAQSDAVTRDARLWATTKPPPDEPLRVAFAPNHQTLHAQFETAFRAYFRQAGIDFWNEANAPEELAAIAAKIAESA